MAAGIEVATLLPEIWAASVTVVSQELSALGPVPNCGVEWEGPEYLQSWDRNRSMFLGC